MDTLETLAWLVLRAGVGLLFLNAAWACGKNAQARAWTVEETAILIPRRYAKAFAYLGIAVMGLGGLSVLTGLGGRAGAAALAAFLIPGTLIHLRKRAEAGQLAAQLPAGPTLTTLRVSAELGHYSSALKNLALCAVAVFLAAAGTGPYTLAP